MEIRFKNKQLKSLCIEEKAAKRTLGKQSARKLRSRYSDLLATANVSELPPVGRPHPYLQDKEHRFSLDLHQGHRILFIPDHDPFPTAEDSGLDWKNVTSIKIISIGDPHD